MMKDAEARKREEEEQMKRLEGRMLSMVSGLQNEETPLDYSLAGLQLGSTRCRILAQNIAYNSSLKTLDLSRKFIVDADGECIPTMLFSNNTLRKLNLEGNCLGPKCAAQFGKALKQNTSLLSLNLESNQLTQDGQECWGIDEFISFLYENKTLISLNIANNSLDTTVGDKLVHATHENTTLIDLNFSFNNFNIEQIRQIQANIKRNKAAYDAERLKEWRERKQMRDEDQKLQNLYFEE
jgi:Ran GTPase-activating protein (RanGAP) involved in mRNA processing and transport